MKNNYKNISEEQLRLIYIKQLRAQINDDRIQELDDAHVDHEDAVAGLEVRYSDSVHAEQLARVEAMLEHDFARYSNCKNQTQDQWPEEAKVLLREKTDLEDKIRVINNNLEDALRDEDRLYAVRVAVIRQNYEAELRAITDIQVDLLKRIYAADIQRMYDQDMNVSEARHE